jgi:hypothetical protein
MKWVSAGFEWVALDVDTVTAILVSVRVFYRPPSLECQADEGIALPLTDKNLFHIFR